MWFCLFSSCHRLGKGKYEDGDGINLNDIEKVLPVWQVGDEDAVQWRPVSPDFTFPWETLLRSGKAAGVDVLRCGPLMFVISKSSCALKCWAKAVTMETLLGGERIRTVSIHMYKYMGSYISGEDVLKSISPSDKVLVSCYQEA